MDRSTVTGQDGGPVDYRVVHEIHDDHLPVLVGTVAHRREVHR